MNMAVRFGSEGVTFDQIPDALRPGNGGAQKKPSGSSPQMGKMPGMPGLAPRTAAHPNTSTRNDARRSTAMPTLQHPQPQQLDGRAGKQLLPTGEPSWVQHLEEQAQLPEWNPPPAPGTRRNSLQGPPVPPKEMPSPEAWGGQSNRLASTGQRQALRNQTPPLPPRPPQPAAPQRRVRFADGYAPGDDSKPAPLARRNDPPTMPVSKPPRQTVGNTRPRITHAAEALDPRVKQDAAELNRRGYKPDMFRKDGKIGKLFSSLHSKMKNALTPREKEVPDLQAVSGYSQGEGGERDTSITWSAKDIRAYLDKGGKPDPFSYLRTRQAEARAAASAGRFSHQSPVKVESERDSNLSIENLDIDKLHMSSDIDAIFMAHANTAKKN